MKTETKRERQARRFKAREIDKWEFYETTKWYPTAKVARAIDAKEDVVRMRRRDLRHMVP